MVFCLYKVLFAVNPGKTCGQSCGLIGPRRARARAARRGKRLLVLVGGAWLLYVYSKYITGSNKNHSQSGLGFQGSAI